MRNSTLWFGRPLPYTDESLASWLRRLSVANGLKPKELYGILVPGGRLYSYDMDRFACSALLDALEQSTGTTKDRMKLMMLCRWDDVLQSATSNRGKLRWRPSAWRDGTSQSYGQQICPYCLATDVEPHYRTHWRLSYLTVCLTHGTLLIDRCSRCGEGIQVLKSDRAKTPHTECWKCSSDYLRTEFPDTPDASATKLFDNIMKAGWGRVGEYGRVHSIAYFEHLHLLYRLLVTGKLALPLRSHLALRLNIAELGSANIPRLEEADRLNTRCRNLVLLAAQKLLETWPRDFVTACRSSEIASGALLKGNRNYPFAYQDSIIRHLSKGHAKTNNGEVISAAKVLTNRDIQPTTKHLEQLMGRKFCSSGDVASPARQCVPYGTHRYWKLDGVSPEVRAAAKLAAKSAGENVGAWVDNTLRRVLTENTK